MDHDKMMVDLSNALNAATDANTRLFKENAELKAENDVIVKQWSADLKSSRERMAHLKAENEGLHEKITRDSREAFRVMARIKAENDDLKTQIEAIMATDPAKVIDTLLADKTNLKYALSSIVSIVKVAEQL